MYGYCRAADEVIGRIWWVDLTNLPFHYPNQLLYGVVETTAWLVASKMHQTGIG
jgi:hypothetical protein